MPDIGFQAKVSCNDGGTQVAIPNAVTIVLPSRERGAIEYAQHDQTHTYMQAIPQLVKAGNLKLVVNYDSPTYTRFNAMLTRKKDSWEVSAPDLDGAGAGTPQKFVFDGFVTKVDELPFEVEGIMQFGVEVKTTGAWTLTAASP